MKKRTSTERYALMLGVVFCLLGVIWLVRPPEGKIIHSTMDRYGRGFNRQGADVEVLTESRGRMYGALTLILGVGFSAMGLYRSEKD